MVRTVEYSLGRLVEVIECPYGVYQTVEIFAGVCEGSGCNIPDCGYCRLDEESLNASLEEVKRRYPEEGWTVYDWRKNLF